MMPPSLETFLSNLDLIDDRQERIEYLISLADRFEQAPQEIASLPYPDDHKVPACESEAYVWATPDGLEFAILNPQGISAKVTAVILKEHLSGAPAEQIAAVSEDIVYRIFGRELSMGKSMGLMEMVRLAKRLLG